MTLTALGSCMCTCHAASPLVVVQTAKDFFFFFFSARSHSVSVRACVWLTLMSADKFNSPGKQFKFKLRRDVKCHVFAHDSRCHHTEVRKILIRSLIWRHLKNQVEVVWLKVNTLILSEFKRKVCQFHNSADQVFLRAALSDDCLRRFPPHCPSASPPLSPPDVWNAWHKVGKFRRYPRVR